ncbi:MAG TPA: hypothetical protein EYQ83_19210 [Acidobacteria bacterium]|nr:hypothetical protein [Acidobacteriota bacterium]
MSTILKALRRLEEDGPTRTTDVGSRADALPATDPRAADELRDRILAEESAAQAGEAAERESDRTKRIVMIAAAAMLVLGVGVGGYVMPTERTRWM